MNNCETPLSQGCQIAKFDPFLSLDCARVEGVGAQSKERKGSNFAAQRSGAIVQKPEGPNSYDSKNPAIDIWQPWSHATAMLPPIFSYLQMAMAEGARGGRREHARHSQ